MLHEKPFVYVSNDEMNAKWGIRIPEWVACERGGFSFPSLIHWKKRKDRTYRYEATLKYARRKDHGERSNSSRIMAEGFHLSVGVQPDHEKIDLTIELRNTSNEVFKRVIADGGCFRHQSQEFFDDHYERTYIETDRGLVPLNNTDRSMGIRCIYFFYPEDYNHPHYPREMEWFWGRSSTRPTSSLIATQDMSGRFAVGIGYEHAFLLSQNSDDYHHCMHSSPYFGTLNPEERRVRRGVILFGQDVKQLFRRFDELGFQQIYQ